MTGRREDLVLEDYSRVLFAGKNELAVMQAVGRYAVEPPEPFGISQIAVDIEQNRGFKPGTATVRKEVMRLIDLDLAAYSTPEATQHQKSSYVRTASPDWPTLLGLIEQWSTPPQKQLELF